MTLKPYIGDSHPAGIWEDLGHGAPTLMAFAQLCGSAIVSSPRPDATLSDEAKAILFAARSRGFVEIVATNTAFEAQERFLAVRVETNPNTTLTFRSRNDPQLTVRFLDAFRELCAAGLVMHHLYRDFSLTRAGFERAAKIERTEVEAGLALGIEHSLE